jgi:NADH:ubiquinone oxidoreductase subunit 4 (subunit M)
VILAAVYLLRALQRMLFESAPARRRARRGRGPACATSTAASSPCSGAFAVAIVWLGRGARAVLRRMEGPVQRLVSQVQRGSAPRRRRRRGPLP